MGQIFTKQSTNDELSDEEIVDKNFLPGVRDQPGPSKNMTMDSAVESSAHSIANNQPSVTLETIAEIDRYLDQLDKISLIYLLYDDSLSEIAFQHCIQTIEGSKIKILEEWIRHCSKNDIGYKNKLLEALAIIQHYQALRILGYNKKEIYFTYFPHNKDMAFYVDLHKKKLYLVFENFSKLQTMKFLSIVKEDMLNKHLHFQSFSLLHLEMYIIYWMTLKYISSNDLTNIIKAFKVMEMYEEADELKRTLPSNVMCTYDDREPTSANYQRSVSISSTSSSNIKEDKTFESYEVNPNNPGICLIINERNFYREFDTKYKDMLPKSPEPLETRTGTDRDRDTLKETFRAFSYEVIIKNNLTHFDMETTIEETVNSVRNHSSLVICILSHGIEGHIFGSNSIPISIKSIQNTMCTLNTRNLEGKPKLLILQSCQGSQCQEVLPELNKEQLALDGPSKTPRMADILTFYATVPGFSAVRDKKNGTWFIQSLCKVIRIRHANYHFEEMCTIVQREVIEKRWETKAMVPLKETTLSKFFYLPVMKQ